MIKIKDKILVYKIKIYIILKQKNNLIKNLILKLENFQEKEDLVKLDNVEVKHKNLIKLKMKIVIMDLKVKLNLINI